MTAAADAPGAARKCRACSKGLAADARKCGHCGALQRDDITCPHCGSNADASPHVELRFVCDICGAPRIPSSDASIPGGEPAVAALRRAEVARRARAAWRAGAILAGLVAPFLLVLTLLAATVFHAFGAAIALALLGVAPAIAGCVVSLRRGAVRGREIAPAIDVAWLEAGAEIARRAGGHVDAAALTAALQLSEPKAEELLALLFASDLAATEPEPRARIAALTEPVAAGTTEIAGADDAAHAAEDAALEEAARAETDAAAGAKPLS